MGGWKGNDEDDEDDDGRLSDDDNDVEGWRRMVDEGMAGVEVRLVLLGGGWRW